MSVFILGVALGHHATQIGQDYGLDVSITGGKDDFSVEVEFSKFKGGVRMVNTHVYNCIQLKTLKDPDIMQTMLIDQASTLED